MSDPLAICLAISVALNVYAFLLLRNKAKRWRKDLQETVNRLYWLKGGKPVKPAPDYFEYHGQRRQNEGGVDCRLAQKAIGNTRTVLDPTERTK